MGSEKDLSLRDFREEEEYEIPLLDRGWERKESWRRPGDWTEGAALCSLPFDLCFDILISGNGDPLLTGFSPLFSSRKIMNRLWPLLRGLLPRPAQARPFRIIEEVENEMNIRVARHARLGKRHS
jgi:hypothetical protein